MRAPRLSKFTRAAIPTAAGRGTSTSHVMGENPRKGKLTEMAGTNPKIFGGSGAKRFGGGMTHDTAPNKDHPDLFTPGIGFAGPGADEPV